MNRLFFALSFAAITLVSACDDNKEAAERSALRSHIMEVHEVEMKQMNRISHMNDVLGVQLQQIDSLAIANDTTQRIKYDEISRMREYLAGTIDGMNGWMELYSEDSANLESPEGTAYLQRQKLAVDNLKVAMDKGIADAENVFRKYQITQPAADTAKAASHQGHSH